MYHYTYEITANNSTDARQKYIGVRSSECYPTEDKYWGSCKAFTEWQNTNGTESLTKKIFAIHQTRALAMEHEIKLHELFDVAGNEEYFNESRATSIGFYQEPKVISADVTKMWQDPEYRKMMSDAHKGQVAWNKGLKTPADVRLKQSAKAEGRASPMKGKKHTVESIKKMSESNKGLIPWITGRRHTAESRAKMRNAQKNRWTDELRKQMSDVHKGQIPWNKGKVGVMPTPWNKGGTHSEASRKKMSESRKGRSYQDIFGESKAEEILEKRRLSMLGDNNPNTNRIYKEADRKKYGDVNRGKCWYNNGKISKMFIQGTEFEGFIKGRGQVAWNKVGIN